MITQERLKELFEYQDNGTFVRKRNGSPIVASMKNRRYARMFVDKGIVCAVHRMIFLWHHGYLPKVIDHIDNDRTNNRIENLREVTQQQNCLNRVAHKNNRSGYKNVHLDKAMNKWTVQISIDRKRRVFGYFDDVELAGLVAEEARDKYHGEFARH